MTSNAIRTAAPLRATRPMRPGGNPVWNVVQHVWLIVVLVLLWWIGSASSTSAFFPPLSKSVSALVQGLGDGTIIGDIGFSLFNLIVALLIASAIGIVFGLVIGEVEWLREVLEPVMHFMRSIPQPALVPLILGAFGIGIAPKIGTIAFACVWPVLLNTIDGVRGGEPVARRMSRIYRIPRLLYFRRVVLPGALPQILAGIRVALPIGIVLMIVSELFASDRGLGYYILSSSSQFEFPQTWAGAIVVGLVGWALSLLFALLERSLLRWYIKSGQA